MRTDDYLRISNNMDKIPRMTLDTTFPVGCGMCGQCCRSNINIILAPHDLYRMARALNISLTDVLKRYCFLTEGEESLLPIVCIRHDKNGVCPLLEGNKCSIQEHKPSICRLFPLGRANNPLTGGEIEYILPQKPCMNGPTRRHSVREWIGPVSSRNSQRSYLLWNELIVCLSMTLRANRDLSKDSSRWNPLMDALVNLMYVLYETDKPFLPQFEKNVGVMREILEGVFQIHVMTLGEINKKYTNTDTEE